MIGKRLSHYEILSKIGEGGMGVVYKARDTKLDREVAIKLLPPEMAGSAERRSRFEREARSIAALRHPNVVTIHSVEEADGHLFLTMELLDGRSLSEMIPAEGLTLTQFFDIAIPVAEALSAAHVAGITHRDLKPANVIVEKDGRVKVLDFGLAKLFQPNDEDITDARTTVDEGSDTQEGHVLGTVPYMSPEQAEGKPVDHRSDIFSLGILLYEMATGERPFKGDTSLSLLSSILKDTPPTVTEIRRHLPQQLARIVEHCLAKDPRRRFQNALDVANELDMLRTEVTTGSGRTRAVAASQGGRIKRIGLIGAAVVLAILAFMLGPKLFDGAGPPESAAGPQALAIFAFDNLKTPDDPERIGQILQELLITDLSGLDAVSVYSGQRLRDLQKQVDASGERGSEVYEEVARRAGASTMLTGTLSQLGEKWILTCQVVDVGQGTIVQSKRIDGMDIYGMVDRLSAEIQAEYRLTDEVDVAQKISVREKTSESLDAYRHYLAGVDHLNALAYVDAVEAFEKAIEIDPEFGKAYYKLGVAKWWQSDVAGAGGEDIRYFLDNELYASEKERRMAEVMTQLIRRDYAKALPMAEALTRDYPDEKEAWYALGEAQYHYPDQSKFFEAEVSFDRAMALDPDFRVPWSHIRSIMLGRGDDDGLRDKIDALLAKNPGDPFWHRENARTAVYFGTAEDTRRAVEEALRFNTTPADRRELYKSVAITAASPDYDAEAMAYLRKAIEVDPDHVDESVVRRLARLLQGAGRYDEAEHVLDTHFADEQYEQAREMTRMWILNERAEYERYRRIATEMARKYPDNVEWLGFWAWGALDTGDDEAFAELLAEVDRRELSAGDRKRVYTSIAYGLMAIGHLNEAIDYWEKARDVRPDDPDANVLAGLSDLERQRGRFDRSERLLRQALEISPQHLGATWGMARLSVYKGDLDSAQVYADRYAGMFRSHWSEWPRVWVNIARGDLDRANAFISDISPRVPDDVKFNFMVSLAWAYLPAYPEKADALYRQAAAMERSARDNDAVVGLGRMALIRGEYAEAKRRFEQALEIEDGSASAWRLLTLLALEQGQTDEAFRCVERWEELDRPSVYRHRVRAYTLAAAGRYEEARREAERAVALDSIRSSHEVLAWTLISGDLDVAAGMAEARRAAALPRFVFSNPLTLFQYPRSADHCLGLGYLAQGDPAKAVDHLTKAAEQHPHRTAVQRDLARARELAGQSP